MEKKHSQDFLRRRKMLLILPFIVIPLLLITFYGLGGGQGKKDGPLATNEKKGFNTNLPGAKFNKQDNSLEKVNAYKKADQDSAKLRDQLREDPYHVGSMPTSSVLPPITVIQGIAPGKDQAILSLKKLPPQDSTADQVLKRLDYLKQSLKQPEGSTSISSVSHSHSPASPPQSSDLPRLEQMMQQVQEKTTAQDPDIEKLNSMLDKIMSIQHPANDPSVTDTSKVINKTEQFILQKPDDRSPIKESSFLDNRSSNARVFFSTDDVSIVEDTFSINVIKAVVKGTQTLVSGGTIEMRIIEEAQVNGISIPKNSDVSGQISLSGERMNILISSITTPKGILSVSLQVYDMDGLAGIRIPGAITRDVAKQSAGQAVSSIGLTTMDPSFSAQMASAGIQAAKTLATRNVKVVRATVPNGYHVFLQNIKH